MDSIPNKVRQLTQNGFVEERGLIIRMNRHKACIHRLSRNPHRPLKQNHPESLSRRDMPVEEFPKSDRILGPTWRRRGRAQNDRVFPSLSTE